MGYDILTRSKMVDESYISPEGEAERVGHEEIAKMLRDVTEADQTRRKLKAGKRGKIDLRYILNE